MKFEKNVINILENNYSNFTNLEKQIANFFISNKEDIDFSSKNIAGILYISEASLSRFSKKCGFEGYREFLYNYKEFFYKTKNHLDKSIKGVFGIYQELINETYNIFDEEKIERIAKFMSEQSRIFVYGKGSSGICADEMQMRFLRIGLDISAYSDYHMMKMSSVIFNEYSLVIGISISGETKEILNMLKTAKKLGAKTVLITANKQAKFNEFVDEILIIAIFNELQKGNFISPQFPILIMLDFIYARVLQCDRFSKEAFHDYTVKIIEEGLI